MKKVALATALVLSSAFALSAYAQEKSRPEVEGRNRFCGEGRRDPEGRGRHPGADATKKDPGRSGRRARQAQDRNRGRGQGRRCSEG